MQKPAVDIAVVGMACRFPGARNVGQFWKNICDGKESIRLLSDDELRSAGVPRTDIQNHDYVKAASILEDIDRFDPGFFKIPPVEAQLLDPQLRLLLQCAWETLEDGGYATDSPQNIGVFSGAGGLATSYYSNFVNRSSRFEKVLASSAHLGNDKDFLSTYISYKLNLTGPSFTIQTACSTSLVAVHQACLSLLNDECEMALAGGVRIGVPQGHGYLYKEGHIFSRSGHVRTFDENADGVVFGSGLGLVLLKRLEAAEKDGDRIDAVIKGSAVANDGREKLSYAASSAKGQIRCMENALSKAQVEADTLGFVESHGTGTLMGDPEEVKALSAAFRKQTDKKTYCALGAVKTNIGHLDAAAGIAGLVKAVLATKTGVIPPLLNYKKPNPRIKFDKTPFYINTESVQWSSKYCPRRAAVNSLGVGGTNAFVVLEEYTQEVQAPEAVSGKPVIVPVSAKTSASLNSYVRKLEEFLGTAEVTRESIGISSLAYTLQAGRAPMDVRAAFIVSSLTELKECLSSYLQSGGSGSDKIITGESAPTVEQDVLSGTQADVASHVDQWVTEGDWLLLASAWVNGAQVDWDRLYGQSRPRRISLPTYAFEEKRYWIDESDLDLDGPSVTDSNVGQLSVHPEQQCAWDGITHSCEWREVDNTDGYSRPVHQNVLVVCCDSFYNFATAILDHYKDLRSQIVVCRLADETKRIDANNWLSDFQDPEVYERCLEATDKFDAVYFLGMGDRHPDIESDEDLSRYQERNEIQLLRLIKYLKQRGKIGESVDTYVLTADNYPLNAGLNTVQGGGVTGVGYSLAQGSYQFLVRNIDLSSRDLEGGQAHSHLLDMVCRQPSSNRGEVFKIESGKLYRQTFYRLEWDGVDRAAIKQNGTYIILGGAGTVGKIFTRQLIDKYQAKVVWIGRSPEDSESVQSALRKFDDKKDNVFYFSADVTQFGSIQYAVESIRSKLGRIHGALFSGQVIDFENSLDNTTEDEFRAILNVKSKGSWNFYKVLSQESPDFICYFSSGQAYAFSGAARLAAYASAITCSDVLVRAIQKQSDFPVGIINWGFWKSTIRNISETDKRVSTDNLAALEDDEGFGCFERFVTELKLGRIRQALCMKIPEQMESLVNREEDQAVALMARDSGMPLTLQASSIEIPDERVTYVNNLNRNGRFDEWLMKLLFHRLSSMLRRLSGRRPGTISDYKRICGIDNKYSPWLYESFSMLSRYGYVQLEGESICEWKDTQLERLWDECRSQMEEFLQDPDYKAMAALAGDCALNMEDVLRGKKPATEVIFPKASMEKVEGVYAHNVISDTYNEILANALVAYIRERLDADPECSLKILEIGAGTGGTSAIVFSKLRRFQDRIAEYCYTDLSKAFFFYAEERYAPNNPFLKCRRLDISKPLEPQGFEVGEYDVVLATNVLHATDNIRQTLSNAKAALRADGFLMLNELSRLLPFHHLTSGLLDGWWLFEDPEIRIPSCPGLYPSEWKRVLEDQGFCSVQFPVESAHEAGQQIVIARSDGFVRRVHTKESDASAVGQPDAVTDNKAERTKTAFEPESASDINEYVTNQIIASLASTLKTAIEDIDPEIVFSEYGLDSILAVNFVDQVSKKLSISLNTAVIFDYSTAGRLSEHIIDTRGDQIEARLPDGVSVSSGDKADDRKAANGTALPGDCVPEDRAARNRGAESPEIAVIGMSGKFPKAENIAQFWENLVNDIDGVEELPDHYLDKDTYFSGNKQPGKTRCKWGGIIADRDCFDPLFFKLTPREAESMNPHQRLVMQESWNAVEDAGYNPKKLAGTQTGVFIGAEPTEYFGETFTGYSDAIIASRLPYMLNLNGPAFVVNTGCSSSAVALHLACESLRSRESDQAIAGGVNACMRQSVHISLSEIEMLSPSGRCATFDSSGDGTVIAEGIGIVMLKRLEDAVVAGDSIYGVICASGINQDGASNGITAPSGSAQEQLITDVYKKYDVDPEQISYVEAHGTGTKLGDPVEANALVRTFEKFTDKRQYCAVGSAKSHIGHTAAAAGVVGLIKVLLSMQNKQVPRLLHFNTLNPLIEFDGSPFYISKKATEWDSPSGVSRMAAINSFGHSGTNAHLVVKEYTAGEQQKQVFDDGAGEAVIIPLSARTEEQLQQRARDLLNFVTLPSDAAGLKGMVDLVRVAYTLQVGREAMDKRLAIVVSSVDGVIEKLSAYLEGRRDIDGFYHGEVKHANKDMSVFNQDDDMKEAVNRWISRGKWSKLLGLWVKGLEVDWEVLYERGRPRRTHLPAYPFAKQRYWMSKDANPGPERMRRTEVLHPLLHCNTSDLSRQNYSSIFTENEFFLKDHKIGGQSVLPAVVYLEMARAAVRLALPASSRPEIFELRNIVWATPIVVDERKRVGIALTADDEEQIDFEIYSDDSEDEGAVQEALHCQGRAVFCGKPGHKKIDIERLKAEAAEKARKSPDLYEIFSAMGLEFGPAHQGIVSLNEGREEVLAQLRLPTDVNETLDAYLLHPSMMDAALQACIGLIVDLDSPPAQPSLPFALEALRIFSPCQREMYVWARYSEGSHRGDRLIKLDVDMCDCNGNVCVQMHGFTSRLFERGAEASPLAGEWEAISAEGDTPVSAALFDNAFYEDVIDRVLANEISVDEAVELG